MKHKTIKTFLIIAAAFCLAFLPITPTFADQCSADVCKGSYPDSVKAACGCSSSDSTLPNVVIGIINAIIGISGLVAVVFIVYGGIQYMTSTGDPGKIKKAKDTILYAVIGLIICVLSFAIVNWAISAINNTNSSGEDSGSSSETTNTTDTKSTDSTKNTDKSSSTKDSTKSSTTTK